MAFENSAIINAQYQQLQADRAQAYADLEAQRHAENEYGTMQAASTILEVDAKLQALDRVANTYVAGQQHQQQANKYGLNADEVTIARGIGHGDPKLTNDERERIYAEQRGRYQRMRASGEYRDDQGTVRR
jgi:hypothetical protein